MSGYTKLRSWWLVLTLSAAVGLPLCGSQAAGPMPAHPNIVIILVDDMGFSDLGCYGSEIPTPNLDRLAANGLRFTQFCNTARCCPTRASLLTGLYSHQAGVGHMTEDRGVDGYRGDLNDRCVTLPEALRPAGYATYAVGKWHVTKHVKAATDAQKYNWPVQRGFDHYYGIIAGAANYFRPNSLTADNERIKVTDDGYYTTDAFVDNAIKFVNGGPKDKPFLLYVAFNAPHFPLMAPAEEIARCRGKYKAGWDRLRQERHKRQIEMGIVDRAWPLSPRPPEVKEWANVSEKEQDRFDQIMAIYAAVVEHMDRAVGRLVEALRLRGDLDNTVILFLSDNGANAESGPHGKLEGQSPGSEHSEVFQGQSWATLSNTPFRRYKHFNHEGGIATPLLVHWPAGLKAHGELRHQPGHLIDLMPTCVELAGAAYPTEFAAKAILPMEGRSLVPAFAGKPLEREAIYWEHEGNGAVRAGDWKLVRLGYQGPWELYDLKADRTELHDLAAEQPERAKELAARWDAWAERAHVKPYPTTGKPKKEKP